MNINYKGRVTKMEMKRPKKLRLKHNNDVLLMGPAVNFVSYK